MSKLDKINEKYQKLGENPDTYLKGLYHAKPLNYWDYVEVDTLLSLQKPRTHFKDETVFIMYHQLTELLLKMMRHELEQIVEEETVTADFLATKISRLNRYTGMLINSFDIMREGMDYDDYNAFRTTLTPASGFQSAQFRYLELYCTRLENLVHEDGKKRLPPQPPVEALFENIYWKDAGLDRTTGKKSLTMRQFESRYLEDLIQLAKKLRGHTLEDIIQQLPALPATLKDALREFDHLYNVAWPMVHLRTAEHYLIKKGKKKAATGGSDWQKYLHPGHQRRIFFPGLWTAAELRQWGTQ